MMCHEGSMCVIVCDKMMCCVTSCHVTYHTTTTMIATPRREKTVAMAVTAAVDRPGREGERCEGVREREREVRVGE